MGPAQYPYSSGLYEQCEHGVDRIRYKKGDAISIIGNNRPEWNFVDLGIMQVGAVTVPIYPTISEEDYVYILNNAEVKMLFVSSQELYEKMTTIKAGFLRCWKFSRLTWWKVLFIGKNS